MKDATGIALYQKAGELNYPVGVMCFKGFGRHVEEIKTLLASSPQTKVCGAEWAVALFTPIARVVLEVLLPLPCSIPRCIVACEWE